MILFFLTHVFGPGSGWFGPGSGWFGPGSGWFGPGSACFGLGMGLGSGGYLLRVWGTRMPLPTSVPLPGGGWDFAGGSAPLPGAAAGLAGGGAGLLVRPCWRDLQVGAVGAQLGPLVEPPRVAQSWRRLVLGPSLAAIRDHRAEMGDVWTRAPAPGTMKPEPCGAGPPRYPSHC